MTKREIKILKRVEFSMVVRSYSEVEFVFEEIAGKTGNDDKTEFLKEIQRLLAEERWDSVN